MDQKGRSNDPWRWALGLFYIVAVASIWIAASYIVQSVVDAGVSPFLVTYICNSLFMVYIPLVEIVRYLEDNVGKFWFWRKEREGLETPQLGDSENSNLLPESSCDTNILPAEDAVRSQPEMNLVNEDFRQQLDSKGRWTRTRVAKVSLLICPFWFLAQLAFNISLKYTTVTSNTILSSASSLFTFLVALVFLGERFTWVKLLSVLLCMGGTIIVSLGDSNAVVNSIASNPLLGDILALVSTCLYAIYITLIRVKLPDDKQGEGQPSMAQFLGFLGLFNFIIFLPVALVLNFTGLEPLHILNWRDFGLIVGKGLLDNVLSDYLWAKAIQLTTTTVATAGLTIQVPLAAVIDSLTGHAPRLMDYLGAASVMVGFVGINLPSDRSLSSQATTKQQEEEVADARNIHVDVNPEDVEK